MRSRVLTAAAAVTAALALPATAQALPSTTLKVRSCLLGDSAKQRQATFYARMRAIPRTSRMWMRFTLVDRSADASDPTAVAVPQLAQWRKSRPGVRSFGYSQTVTGLQTGGIYAMQVEFRWLDASGHTIRTLERTSGDCRQEGALANLAVTQVTAKPGDALGTEAYGVSVVNNGAVEARQVLVELFVDGAGADAVQVDSISPGETATVHVQGPACRRRVRAVVDRPDAIHETNEDDNVLRSRCPMVLP